MLDVKNALRLRFPCFMSNIIKILLFREELRLACLLTSMYEISIDDEMLKSAIEYDQFEWLDFVWAFGKNYRGPRRLQ